MYSCGQVRVKGEGSVREGEHPRGGIGQVRAHGAQPAGTKEHSAEPRPMVVLPEQKARALMTRRCQK